MSATSVFCKRSYTFVGESKTSFTEGKVYPIHLTASDHIKGYAITNDLGEIHWIREPGHPDFDEFFRAFE